MLIPFWVDATHQLQIQTAQGHLVWVHRIHGLPKTIVRHADSSCLYESYWDEGEQAQDPKSRCWRRYRDAWSLHRGLEQARLRAIKVRLPLLRELHTTCERSAAHLLGPDHKRPETLAEITAFVTRFLSAIRMPQTHALKAAQAQVAKAASPTDALGRHNPRARAAHLLQVSGCHLPQRIADIIGWLGHYAHWADDVGRLQQLAGGFLDTFRGQVARWAAGLRRGQPTRLWQAELRPVEISLTRLAAFGGWTAWARHCLLDLKLLRSGHPATASDACARLEQSLVGKQLQAEISRLMVDLEASRLDGTFRPMDCLEQILALRRKVEAIQDNRLRQPVRRGLIGMVAEAIRLLRTNREPSEHIRDTRGALRRMCAAL